MPGNSGENKNKPFDSSIISKAELALGVSAFFGLLALAALLVFPLTGPLIHIATFFAITSLIVAVVFLTVSPEREKQPKCIKEKEISPEKKSYIAHSTNLIFDGTGLGREIDKTSPKEVSNHYFPLLDYSKFKKTNETCHSDVEYSNDITTP